MLNFPQNSITGVALGFKINFSKTELLKIKPLSKRAYYSDTKARGLVIDVLPSGVISFQIYRKFKGMPKRITLGRFDSNLPDSVEFNSDFEPLTLLGNSPNLNVRMARILANSVNSKLDAGIEIDQIKKAIKEKSRGELTLLEAFNYYKINHLIPNEIRTIDDLQDNFKRYLGEVLPGQKKTHGKERVKPKGAVNWENRKLSTITTNEIKDTLNEIKKLIGDHTANRTLELLRAIFNFAKLNNQFEGLNPCIGISKFKVESRARFLKSDEIPAFFEAIDTLEDKSKQFFLISLFTGARKSNVMEMKWSDIDFYSKTWTIPNSSSKNKKPMYINLTQIVVDILQLRKGLDITWVFPADSKSGHMESPKKEWAKLLSNAGIQDLRIHDLRRTLGSYAAMTNASLPIIGKLLGHHSVEATKVYAHLQQEPVVIAINRASDEIIKLSKKT